MIWSAFKHAFATLLLIFVFVVLPLIAVNALGLSERVGIWNLTYQEITGIGGALSFGLFLFGFFYFNSRKKQST